MEDCVFKQIYTQKNSPLRAYIAVLEKSVEVILFQNENAWKSVVIKTDLSHFAGEYKLTLEKYCQNLLEYVKNSNSNIVFILNDEEFTINRCLEGSLMVKYFTCKVEKVDYVQHVEQIMDKFYLEGSKLSENLNTLTKEKEEITKQKNCCESKLKELVNKKIAEENEQFGRFVLILNEKKRRIQHLTELLEAFKKGRPTMNPEVKVTSRKRQRDVENTVTKKETISDSEASESSDDGSSSVDSPKPAKESKPSTSAVSLDFLEDNFEQSHILPKRVKQQKVEKDAVVAIPAPKSPEKTEELEKTESKAPVIDISTQQLLDML